MPKCAPNDSSPWQGGGWEGVLLRPNKLKSKPHPNPPLEKRGGSLSFPGFLINGMGIVYKSQVQNPPGAKLPAISMAGLLVSLATQCGDQIWDKAGEFAGHQGDVGSTPARCIPSTVLSGTAP